MIGAGTSRAIPRAAAILLAVGCAARAAEEIPVLVPGRPRIFQWRLRTRLPPASGWVFLPRVEAPRGFRFRALEAELERGMRLHVRFELEATPALPPGAYAIRVRYAAVRDTSPYNPRTSGWVVDRKVQVRVVSRTEAPPDRSPYGRAAAAFARNRLSEALEALARAPQTERVARLRRIVEGEPFRSAWSKEALRERMVEIPVGGGRRVAAVCDLGALWLAEPLARIHAAVTGRLGIRPPVDIVPRVHVLTDPDLFETFADLLGEREPQRRQAFYARDLAIIAIRNVDDALRPQPGGLGSFAVRLLFQEYARFVLDAALGPAPPWLEDGMALRFAAYRLGPEGKVVRGAAPREVVETVYAERYRVPDGWLAGFLEMDRKAFDRDRSVNAALAWHLMGFIERTRGRAAIRGYIRALEAGRSWREAAGAILAPGLEPRWQAALRAFHR